MTIDSQQVKTGCVHMDMQTSTCFSVQTSDPKQCNIVLGQKSPTNCSRCTAYFSVCSLKACAVQGQIQDLVQGGPKFCWPIFANSVQQSHANKVSSYWLGSDKVSIVLGY